jgi:prevent-host-death family protein
MSTRTIPAGEFKAKCLALMDEVAASGDEIIVTKRGRAVVRLVKAELPRDWRTLLGTAHWVDDEDVVGPTPELEMASDDDDPLSS